MGRDVHVGVCMLGDIAPTLYNMHINNMTPNIKGVKSGAKKLK